MISGGFLNDNAMRALKSKDFATFVNSLQSENRDNVELSSSYREDLERQLAKGPDQIDRFACGIDLCVMSLQEGQGDQWFTKWYETLPQGSRLPMYAITAVSVDHGGGAMEHRLLFTTNSRVHGFFTRR